MSVDYSNLSLNEGRILQVLLEEEMATASEVANRVSLSPGHVRRKLNDLYCKGFVDCDRENGPSHYWLPLPEAEGAVEFYKEVAADLFRQRAAALSQGLRYGLVRVARLPDTLVYEGLPIWCGGEACASGEEKLRKDIEALRESVVGRVVLYDDDTSWGDFFDYCPSQDTPLALVYFGEPFANTPSALDYSCLEVAEENIRSLGVEEWIKRKKSAAALLGIQGTQPAEA
jgi:hypothetical protein